VLFTSGATEADNLALLGLAEFGRTTGRRHIVSTRIEHKAVLEPLEHMAKQGFEVDPLDPTPGGWVPADAVARALRPDTLLVSVMHVNNETGIVQPLRDISAALAGHEAFFHVDAAQGFGKADGLQDPRIDLVSLSGHKVCGPKGVGALVMRRRGFRSVPLQPLMFGGGQERGLRPGTLPVALVAALGKAAELAVSERDDRARRCRAFRDAFLAAFAGLDAHLHGDVDRCLPHVVNLSIPGVDSEAALVALKDVAAVSNGSACTSHSYQPSHVLVAMGLPDDAVQGALRFSWWHDADSTALPEIAARLAALKPGGWRAVAEPG
jgi:cysteine desulfurase